jgi:hypothetical protein
MVICDSMDEWIPCHDLFESHVSDPEPTPVITSPSDTASTPIDSPAPEAPPDDPPLAEDVKPEDDINKTEIITSMVESFIHERIFTLEAAMKWRHAKHKTHDKAELLKLAREHCTRQAVFGSLQAAMSKMFGELATDWVDSWMPGSAFPVVRYSCTWMYGLFVFCSSSTCFLSFFLLLFFYIVTHTHTHTHTLSLSLSHTHTHTHTHTRTHAYWHTRTHLL